MTHGKEVEDVALLRDLSEPALQPCPIPYWQGADFSRVMPVAGEPLRFFTTTNASTQPS